jgi:hypothetical protein
MVIAWRDFLTSSPTHMQSTCNTNRRSHQQSTEIFQRVKFSAVFTRETRRFSSKINTPKHGFHGHFRRASRVRITGFHEIQCWFMFVVKFPVVLVVRVGYTQWAVHHGLRCKVRYSLPIFPHPSWHISLHKHVLGLSVS